MCIDAFFLCLLCLLCVQCTYYFAFILCFSRGRRYRFICGVGKRVFFLLIAPLLPVLGQTDTPRHATPYCNPPQTSRAADAAKTIGKNAPDQSTEGSVAFFFGAFLLGLWNGELLGEVLCFVCGDCLMEPVEIIINHDSGQTQNGTWYESII